MLNCAARQHYGHSIGLYLRLYFLLWPNWPKPDWTGGRTNASALVPSVCVVHTSNGGTSKCAIRKKRTDCNSMSTQAVVFARNIKMNVLRQRTYLVNGKEPSMWWRHGRTVCGNDTSNSLRPAGSRVCWTKTTSKHSPSSSSSPRWTSSHRLVATPQSINSGERCDYDQFMPTNRHRNLSYTNAATTRKCRGNSRQLGQDKKSTLRHGKLRLTVTLTDLLNILFLPM